MAGLLRLCRCPAAWLRTMGPWLPALLCLGLYLGQETGAQEEPLPQPQIFLERGSVIMVGQPMAIRCRGPPEAQLFFLQKEKADDFVDTQQPVWNEVIFSFPKMKLGMAGVYSCFYGAGARFSPPSERLNLAVSGVLPRPFLSVKPSTKVAPGKRLSFKCWTDQHFDRLIVYQNQGFVPPMYRLAPNSEVELTFPKISAKHGGIYSCIGFVSREPLMWSMPSDPVVLTVSQSQDRTVGTIFLGVLLALGTLLAWAWTS